MGATPTAGRIEVAGSEDADPLGLLLPFFFWGGGGGAGGGVCKAFGAWDCSLEVFLNTFTKEPIRS